MKLHALSLLAPAFAVISSQAFAQSAVRSFSDSCYQPTNTVNVSIHVDPASTVISYSVNDTHPLGWVVTNVSSGGSYNAATRTVSWGPYLDSTERTFTYDATPPIGSSTSADFSGQYTANGSPSAITGSTRINPCRNVSLTVLTPFTDIWGSTNVGGTFQPPSRFAYIGFHHDPVVTNWITLAGDYDGDGLTDFACVTEFGDMWVSLNGGGRTLHPPFRSAFGYLHDDDQRTTVVGDFNGDGKTDALQMGHGGSLAISYNVAGQEAPHGIADNGLQYDASQAQHIVVGDFNGDGRDDVGELRGASGEVYVMLATTTGFTTATFWGEPEFVQVPDQGYGVCVGDFDGDGRDDLLQIHNGTTRVALASSSSDSFDTATSWGNLGFNCDSTRGKGWWVFALDTDGNGRDDLVQITEYGDAWVATSNGGGFNGPNKNASLGFEHKPEGQWQIFPSVIN